ncbi:MAG: hypothetical protein DRN04_07480 [Thermoprotei archaeon]|nr:MAG: hypothetical protein DRN04_07480 [Thermoprotei archaeon]
MSNEEVEFLKYIAWKQVVPAKTSLNTSILRKLTSKGLVRIISHKYTDYKPYIVLTKKGKNLLRKNTQNKE